MKILAFAASNSRNSINKSFVIHATEIFKRDIAPNADIEIIDLNDFEMPLFSIDREQNAGIPEQAHRFLQAIREANALIVSYAEHNGSYTAAFKNLFDWTSRIDVKVYQNKPMVALSTSPGKRGGATVLNTVLSAAPRFGGDVVASLSVGSFNQSFDVEQGEIADRQLAAKLYEALSQLGGRLSAA